MRSYIRFGVMLALSFSAGIRVIADGELDGVIGAQYGATIALDALDDGRCGENSIAEACDRGDLVELNALSWPDVAEGFQWYFEFTVDSSQSLSDAGEALEVFGSTCSERVTYFIGLDADCDGAPFLDMLDMPAPWSRNFSWQVDYFIVVHPAGPFDMAAELWAYTEEGIPPVFLVEVPVVTTVRGYRRTVELVLPIDSNVPNAIRKNKPIRVMVLAAEEVEGHDGGVYDWIGGAEPGECWESAEFSSDLYYCTAPTAKVSGAPTDPGINTLQSLSLPARDEAAMISSGLDCEAGGSQITVDGYVDDDLYTHLVEALFAAPYQGGSLEDSDAIGEPSAARFVDEEGLTDLEALGIQADIQQVLVSTDPDYLHIIVQGPTALGWTGVDVANLYIAIDVPVRESGTDSGSDCDAQANAPAGRAVNFQGWDPDWVVEITDPAQAFLWESDQDEGWDEVGHAINMETELIDAPLGFYYAADSEGYEVAIPWVKLGYTEPEFDPQTIRLAVYTTGDEQIGGRSDWDVYDQAPGVGQGGTGLGAPETLADGPGDSDCSDESALLRSDYTHGPGTTAEGLFLAGSDAGLPVLSGGLTVGDVDTIASYYVVEVFEEQLLCGSACVPDLTAPEVFCPPQYVDECEIPEVATSVEEFFAQGGVVDDDCDGEITIQHLGDGSNGGTGCGESPLIIEREYRIYDASGNFEDCAQEIFVVDEEAPEIEVNEEVELLCGDDIDPEAIGYPYADDNCGEVELSYSDEVVNEACPVAIIRTWTATDLCGQESTAEQLILLNDVFPPELDLVLELEAECGDDLSPEALGFAEAFDACDAEPVVTYEDDLVPGECEGQYIIARYWTATDACGNQSDAEQIIRVSDTTAPVLEVPEDVVVGCGEDTTPEATGLATAEDGCAGELAADFTDVILPGDCDGSYTIERTWTAVDPCGNEAGGIQRITVVDDEAPSLSVPEDLTLSAGTSTDPSSTGMAIAEDACGSVTVTYVDELQGGCPAELVRTWVAEDDCGNRAEGVQVITLADVTPPEITCPAEASASCGVVDPDPAQTGYASAVDACEGVVAVTYSDLLVPGEPDQIIRTWSAEDSSGNQASCEQVITLAAGGGDVAFVDCPVDLELLPCDDVPAPADMIALDACGQRVAVTLVEEITSEPDTRPWWWRWFNLGTEPNTLITRTWTAASASGETATCTQVITIRNDQDCVKGILFWIRNPNAWPVNELTIGCTDYNRNQLRSLLRGRDATGVQGQLVRELIPALLSIENGACPSAEVAACIADAQQLLCDYSLTARRLPNAARRQMQAATRCLLRFNVGAEGTPRCL